MVPVEVPTFDPEAAQRESKLQRRVEELIDQLAAAEAAAKPSDEAEKLGEMEVEQREEQQGKKQQEEVGICLMTASVSGAAPFAFVLRGTRPPSTWSSCRASISSMHHAYQSGEQWTTRTARCAGL